MLYKEAHDTQFPAIHFNVKDTGPLVNDLLQTPYDQNQNSHHLISLI